MTDLNLEAPANDGELRFTNSVDFNLLHQLGSAIDRAQHDLVAASGLVVADGAAPEETFKLDFSETILVLQRAQIQLSGIELPVTKRKRTHVRSRMPSLSRGVIQQIADEMSLTRQAIYQRYYSGNSSVLRRAIEIERERAEERRKLAQELRKVLES